MNSKKNAPETKKIRKILIDQDLKIVKVARAIGESTRMTTYVISGERISWHIRYKIADFLGVPAEEIFPSNDKREAA